MFSYLIILFYRELDMNAKLIVHMDGKKTRLHTLKVKISLQLDMSLLIGTESVKDKESGW
jgi:hypothetical protein